MRKSEFKAAFETHATAKVAKAMNEMGRNREPFFFLFDFLLKKPVLIPLKNWSSVNAHLQMPGWNRPSVEFLPAIPPKFCWETYPVDFDSYKKAFDRVQKEIRFGNSYLLNLTQPTKVVSNLSLLDLYHHSDAPFKLYWNDEFVSFSPERFVQVKGNRIETHPMKGTIAANIPNAAQVILADRKEMAEHYTIVDLLRNDLSTVAKKVRVNNFRYLSEINTHKGKLLQVSSEISGILPDDWRAHIGNWFVKLLPAGSICGAPKKKTVEIITEAEGYERGYYTGVFGIFDGENLDSAVAIRYLENKGGNTYFKSGGGITALSSAHTEYQEMLDKIYVPINRNHLHQTGSGSKFGLAPEAIG
ncbi:MAG: aminodeoxychorismate synthase component I [Saprospiraceae bacterium]